MSAKFVPERLQLAREFRQFSLEELASRTDLTRQSISQFERSERFPAPDTLRRLSEALQLPPEFFFRPLGRLASAKHSLINYRSLKSTREVVRAQRADRAMLTMCATLVDCLDRYIEFGAPTVPKIDDGVDPLALSLEDIEAVAEATRVQLGLGVGPISDVTLLVENQSVIVCQLPMAKGMEGLSRSFAERPFIATSGASSYARGRISVAHEFGHLVLHHALSGEEELDQATFDVVEDQAWRFAGAFLLPHQSFLSDIYSVSLDELARLKKKWGVSIGAMTKRLLDLGVIDAAKYKSMRIQLSQRKWHLVEPGDDAPPESPRLLNKAASFLADSGELSLHELAMQVALPVELLSSILGMPKAAFLSPKVANILPFQPRIKAN